MTQLEAEAAAATGVHPDQTLTLSSVVGDKDLADPAPVQNSPSQETEPTAVTGYVDAFLKAQALFIHNQMRYYTGQMADKDFISAQTAFISANNLFLHSIGVL